jgi:hypothetical protein
LDGFGIPDTGFGISDDLIPFLEFKIQKIKHLGNYERGSGLGVLFCNFGIWAPDWGFLI